jgi:hypothetical protein
MNIEPYMEVSVNRVSVNTEIFQNKQEVVYFLEKVNTEIIEPDNLEILESLIFNPVDVKYILETNLEVLEKYYLYFVKEKVEYRVRIIEKNEKYLSVENKSLGNEYFSVYNKSIPKELIMLLLKRNLGLVEVGLLERENKPEEYPTEFYFGRISN